MYIAVILL